MSSPDRAGTGREPVFGDDLLEPERKPFLLQSGACSDVQAGTTEARQREMLSIRSLLCDVDCCLCSGLTGGVAEEVRERPFVPAPARGGSELEATGEIVGAIADFRTKAVLPVARDSALFRRSRAVSMSRDSAPRGPAGTESATLEVSTVDREW